MINTIRSCCFLVAFIHSLSVSAQTVSTVSHVKGSPRAWITNVAVLSGDVFLMSGLYQGEFFIGRDTLNSKSSNAYLTFVGKDGVKKVREMTGSINKIFVHDKSVFLTGFRGERGFKNQVLTKLSTTNVIQWEYTMALVDSLPGSMLEIQDVCFGHDESIYVLYQLTNGMGKVQVSTNSVKTFAELLVRFDKNGKMISSRKLSDRQNTYYRLRMYENSMCVYGASRSFLMLDKNLKEVPLCDDAKEATKFTVWNKNDLYRIKEVGFRPKRCYAIEKYNVKNKHMISRELFRDTVRFQHEIHQYELLDYNKKEIVGVYVSRGNKKANTLEGKDINVVMINKKDLHISRQFTVHTEKLIIESLDKAVFEIQGNDLLIGHEYQTSCQVGDLTFEDTKGEKSFFVVRMNLK